MAYQSPYHGVNVNSMLRLATNENSHPLAEKIVDKLTKDLSNVNRYPSVVNDELKELIAKKHNINKDNVVIGSGSDELIVLSALKYISNGDNSIMCTPSFFRYKEATELAKGICKTVECYDFQYNLQGILDSIDDKTRIIFICNPNNPTGTFINLHYIEDFLKKIRKDIIVVIDEAYFDFVYPEDTLSSISLINKYQNIFVLRTFSKFYGLAGLRIGYGIANTSIIKAIESVRPQYNVNSIAQQAATLVLTNKSDEYYNYYLEIVNEREYYYHELQSMNLKFYESQANFIFVHFGEHAQLWIDLLKQQGIIIRPCAMFGFPEYVRITIGTHSENKKLIEVLKSIINSFI